MQVALKQEDRMVQFCKVQLDYLKRKRILKQLKLYCMWSNQWVASVRAAAQQKTIKEAFRCFLLNTHFESINRRRNQAMQKQIIQELRT